MNKDLYKIIITKKLSEPELEDLIKKYPDKINWTFISYYQKLSESFIEKYKDKINWHWISYSQKLSESFIEKYKDELDWEWISKYQKLSEKFIRKNINKITNDIFQNKDYNKYSDELKLILRLKVK